MKTKTQHAFSLIELIVTLAIAGILMMFAIPNMSQFVKNDRLTSYSNSLLVDLILARSKAVQRNQSTIVCSSNDLATCTGDNFEDGWIVGIDINNDGTLNADDELIKVNVQIEGDIQYIDNGMNTIIFDTRGFAPTTNGLLSVCDERGDSFAKIITISPTGRTGRRGTAAC